MAEARGFTANNDKEIYKYARDDARKQRSSGSDLL